MCLRVLLLSHVLQLLPLPKGREAVNRISTEEIESDETFVLSTAEQAVSCARSILGHCREEKTRSSAAEPLPYSR